MKNTYAEKLKHPKWQKKRLEIFNRDEFTCQLCGDSESTLHVHHKSYAWNKDPWEYENDNFQTLCEVCHMAVEKFKAADFITPVSAFKIIHDEYNLTYLNVTTKIKTDNTVCVQVFKLWNGEFTHLLAMRKETLQRIIESIDRA